MHYKYKKIKEYKNKIFSTDKLWAIEKYRI